MNIVLDTNVLVSALYTSNSESPTVKVLELVFCGELNLLCNEEIITEYEEVLRRPKFNFPDSLVSSFIDSIRKISIMTEQKPCNEVFNDPDDRVFYEIALSKENTYLTTGNIKHFPKSPIVVTPSEFLSIYLSGE